MAIIPAFPEHDGTAKALSALVEQIVRLTPEQQRRLSDVALGMYLQKEAAEGGDKNAS